MQNLRCLVYCVVVVLTSCGGSGGSVASIPRKVKCTPVVAAEGSVQSNTFSGKVVAKNELNLGFRTAGVIDRVYAKDGARVRKGEVLATLDSRDYELQLAATQAEYDAIKAEVDRVVELYAHRSVSPNDYDKAINGMRAIATKLEAHKNSVKDCQLTAPMDCYVIGHNFGKGEAVAAGTPVVSVISTGTPQISVDMPARNYLKRDSIIGASAVVEHMPQQRFDLRLNSASPRGNLNQLYRVVFDIEPALGAQYPAVGMSATVEVNYRSGADSLLKIPLSAVLERDGVSSVWVLEEGCVEGRRVDVVEVSGNDCVYVSGGVSEGELVVVAGINSLVEGQRVVPLDANRVANIN